MNRLAVGAWCYRKDEEHILLTVVISQRLQERKSDTSIPGRRARKVLITLWRVREALSPWREGAMRVGKKSKRQTWQPGSLAGLNFRRKARSQFSCCGSGWGCLEVQLYVFLHEGHQEEAAL